MELADLQFECDQFSRALENADLSSALRRLCDDYFVLLGKQSELSEDLAAPLKFLSMICSWRLRADNPWAPFESLWTPTSPESVTEAQLDCVTLAVPMIADHDIRARLADLLWLRRRCHKSARAAAEAYLTSAERLIESGQILGERERLRRALQISSHLGRGGEWQESILRRVLAIASNTGVPHCTAADALDLLTEYVESDSDKCYSIAKQRVGQIKTEEGNPLWERRFWDIAAKFATRGGDETARRQALLEIAKSFECVAEAAPSNAVAFAHWQMALHAYRRVPDTAADRTRVHRKLLDAQQGLPGEMVSIGTGTLDLSDLVGSATARVTGIGLPTALAELVFATRWQPKADVRRQAQENMERYPIQHLFPSTQLGSTGKVAANAPSGIPQGDQFSEDRLFAEMCRHYRYFISVVANGSIEPIRHELLRNHAVTIDDVAHLLQHSPYVPHGREAFWVIGIHAGIQGRFIESLHVLIPQVEHLLRTLCEANGLIASGLDDDGIQQEHDLNRLLRSADGETLLGEDLCFVLRVILIERFGYNLRNEMAHGMLSPGAFYTDASIYGWWLLMRLVAGPVAEVILAQPRDSTASTDSPRSD